MGGMDELGRPFNLDGPARHYWVSWMIWLMGLAGRQLTERRFVPAMFLTVPLTFVALMAAAALGMSDWGT